MAASLKVVLSGTELDVRASDAQAIAHYYVDLGDGDTSTPVPGANATLSLGGATPQTLDQALMKVPQIGDMTDFNQTGGAPLPQADAANPTKQYFTHKLRVSRQRVYPGGSQNPNKLFVDVYYSSKPRPVIELGSSAVQQKTQTYLTEAGSNSFAQGSADPKFRQQMVLDYILKKGSLFPQTTDANGTTPSFPPYDIPYMKTPGEGSMFRFGASLRVSSWWFNDEVTQDQFSAMSQLAVSCTNKGPFLFSDDDQRWLCTALPTQTTDGGWTTRVTGEFVYSPWGWDTYLNYNDPLLNAPALLSSNVLTALYTRGTLGFVSGVPSPFPASPATGTQSSSDPIAGPGSGAGRFPQQLCRPFRELLGFLSDGILAPKVDISIVLNASTGSRPGALPTYDGSGNIIGFT